MSELEDGRRTIISEGKRNRELVEHFSGIGISKNTGKKRIVSRTFHQTKIDGIWVNNKDLKPKKSKIVETQETAKSI